MLDLICVNSGEASVDVVKAVYTKTPDSVSDDARHANVSGALIDEKVHVVIINRNSDDNWMFSAATDNNEKRGGVETVLEKTMSISDYAEYKKFPYDTFADYHAEVFLPIAFTGCTTRRATDEIVQAFIPKEKNEGTRFQNGMAVKKRILESNIYTCSRLAYMVYFGAEAIDYYKTDYNDDPQKLTARYKKIVAASNYGMWGKWYTPDDGWHRGIDMNYAKDGNINCPVYPIIGGAVVDRSSYYLSIYNPEIDITVTYMHLSIGKNIKDVNPDYPQVITISDTIGLQSNQATASVHTHIEFNKGKVINDKQKRAFARPWSSIQNENMVDIPVTKIRPGVIRAASDGVLKLTFSLEPYSLINSIWGYRMTYDR